MLGRIKMSRYPTKTASNLGQPPCEHCMAFFTHYLVEQILLALPDSRLHQ